MKIEEPYSYRERLTMPKMIINSTGDQFFLPDSSQFYFNELKGEKLLRYVPNTDHSLRNSDARQTLVAFYDAVLRGKPRPRYSWKINGDTIRVQTPDQHGEVKFWHATNAEKRDFRLETIGNAYTSAPVSESSDGVYIAKVPKPAKGWTAGFMELTFATGGPYPIKVTTDVKVIPETLPHKPYQPKREYISRPTR
jgi:PhoPQ-activated pathogenicity-related protein